MYDHGQEDWQLVVAVSVATADPLAGARLFPGFVPITVRVIWATITTNIATATLTLTYKYRPTPGSASGEVVIGTMTIAVGASAVAGKSWYKKVTPYKALPGGEVVCSASGGATGNATVGITSDPSWDNAGNNLNLVASP